LRSFVAFEFLAVMDVAPHDNPSASCSYPILDDLGGDLPLHLAEQRGGRLASPAVFLRRHVRHVTQKKAAVRLHRGGG